MSSLVSIVPCSHHFHPTGDTRQVTPHFTFTPFSSHPPSPKARLEKLQRQQARALRRLARHERAARERRRFAPANDVRDAVPPPGTSNYLPSMETAAEFEIALAEMREVEAALRLKRRFHGWLEELLDAGPLTYWETLYADELTEWETFGEGARWKGRFRTGQPTFADNASAQLAELDAMADKIARQKKEKNKKRAWTKLKVGGWRRVA